MHRCNRIFHCKSKIQPSKFQLRSKGKTIRQVPAVNSLFLRVNLLSVCCLFPRLPVNTSPQHSQTKTKTKKESPFIPTLCRISPVCRPTQLKLAHLRGKHTAHVRVLVVNGAKVATAGRAGGLVRVTLRGSTKAMPPHRVVSVVIHTQTVP